MLFKDDDDTHDQPASRDAYRVPIGMPLRDEGRGSGAVVSVLVHVLVIGLLIIPFFMPSSVIDRIRQGAGGAGPAGGGGGGSAGPEQTNTEALRFVKVSPTPVPTPTSLPPVPKPEIAVPKPVPPVTPVSPPSEQAAAPTPSTTVAAAIPSGAGSGAGSGALTGAGPGSGGGVGSGIGTGRGSAVGAGTGGGTQANYPPQPIEFFLPPLPPPASVRGFRFIAEFDVDSTGRVVDFKFSETRDGGYNRRIAGVLRSMRFRPGTRPDGSPLRMKAQVGYEF